MVRNKRYLITYIALNKMFSSLKTVYPKYWNTLTLYRTCSKIWRSSIFLPAMCLLTAGWVANSVDPDQILHSVASDLGLLCLLRPIRVTSELHRPWPTTNLILIWFNLYILWANSADDKLVMFFSYFSHKTEWHFMQIGDNLHEMSNLVFYRKIRKNISICLLQKILLSMLCIISDFTA